MSAFELTQLHATQGAESMAGQSFSGAARGRCAGGPGQQLRDSGCDLEPRPSSRRPSSAVRITRTILTVLKREYDDIESIYEHLVLSDIRAACLTCCVPSGTRATARMAGVSWEESPGIAHNAAASVSAAERLKKMADRPNLLIKVPATEEGIEGVRTADRGVASASTSP